MNSNTDRTNCENENNMNKMTSHYNWVLVSFCCVADATSFSSFSFSAGNDDYVVAARRFTMLFFFSVLSVVLSLLALLSVFGIWARSVHFPFWNESGFGREIEVDLEIYRCGISSVCFSSCNVKWREITGKFSSAFWNVDNVAVGI